eukprot:TRINITY_DN15932_c0_g1_i1.p3 TRINITY_DN15932_c0_g1~~TRINITY_DN15932_c0_g1_i1.p3  ORF type:complete len:183 (-),score=30.24 TRINITY_DN15932_c0_g1_i1:171-719(-)
MLSITFLSLLLALSTQSSIPPSYLRCAQYTNSSTPCVSCPPHFAGPFCSQCAERQKLPLGNECVACAAVNAMHLEGQGCVCPDPYDLLCCPKSLGVVKNGHHCYTCSSKFPGCKNCEFSGTELITCTSCYEGYEEVWDDDRMMMLCSRKATSPYTLACIGGSAVIAALIIIVAIKACKSPSI